MANPLKEKFATRLKQVIGKQPIIDLADRGGPSKSYIYRMKQGKANPSLEEMDAVLRAYGSSLGDFFESWREEERVRRQQLAVEARALLEKALDSDVDVVGLVSFLRALVRQDHSDDGTLGKVK